jgi:hypothetical protein
VVKHVDAVELRVVVAAVLAVAADAVLVAQHLKKFGALEAWRKREKKGGEEQRNVRKSMWYFGTENRKCRWRASACIPNGKAKWFYHSHLSSFGTVQRTLVVVGCGRDIFASATC